MFRTVILVTSLLFATSFCFKLEKNITQDESSLPHNFGNRIINGRPVAIGEAPYMASLRSLTGVHFCGAAIISSTIVVTSNLCTLGRANAAINVIVGTNTLLSGGITHLSNLIIRHPGFIPQTLMNEYAYHINAINY